MLDLLGVLLQCCYFHFSKGSPTSGYGVKLINHQVLINQFFNVGRVKKTIASCKSPSLQKSCFDSLKSKYILFTLTEDLENVTFEKLQ